MSRRKYATRWNEINCQVQDMGCNVFNQGEQFKFAIWLDDAYGKGTADSLVLESNQTVKYTTEELERKIEGYKEMLSEL